MRSEEVERFPPKVTPAVGGVHAKHTETDSSPIEDARTPGHVHRARRRKREKRETGHQDKHGHSGKRFEARCGRPRKETAQNEEGATARIETEESTAEGR